jgi:prepilin-type N-terminal cleavage/methylation domain-containing protein
VNSKGFTLVEMMIATGIMTIVVFGGFQAYQYFNSQTIKEAKKMDDLSEFNALTKDLVSFTEGGGISTFYLNQPVKTKNCNDTEPCVRQLVGQNFVAPTSALPNGLTGNDCMQFYSDAGGKLEGKKAYPGKITVGEKIWKPKVLELSDAQELYATWILKDETSPPFLMAKTRDASVFLRLLRGPQSTIERISSHGGLQHAFFDSDATKEAVTGLVGYPFLIYNALYNNQYNIQYAQEIISCTDHRSDCIALMQKVQNMAGLNDVAISNITGAIFPDQVFAVLFRPIDFQVPFFKNIVDRQQLPSTCLSSWGNGIQSSSDYFFPTKALSVSLDPDETNSELGTNPLNLFYLSKYATKRDMPVVKGIFVAMPIDIVTYKVEAGASSGVNQLVSELWHHTEIKKKTKIHKLTSPFTVVRKLGSPEMGMWYNPIKKNQP